MELQWDKKQLPCLREKVRQVQNQEQTLEVRLGDELPDIGRVLIFAFSALCLSAAEKFSVSFARGNGTRQIFR